MLIRSLIVQFAAPCSYLPDLLRSIPMAEKTKQPTIEEMTTTLRHILIIFNAKYILLDALDECTDQEYLFELIKALMGWNINDFHILATSRKENDIATSFEPLVTCQLCIQNALVDADIRVHVLRWLSNDSKLKKWRVDVQEEIKDGEKLKF